MVIAITEMHPLFPRIKYDLEYVIQYIIDVPSTVTKIIASDIDVNKLLWQYSICINCVKLIF